jgi:hypothetical protein
MVCQNYRVSGLVQDELCKALHNSSAITRSYFSNLSSNERRVEAPLASFSWLISSGTVVKNTRYPARHALIPSPVAIIVLPVPGWPSQ